MLHKLFSKVNTSIFFFMFLLSTVLSAQEKDHKHSDKHEQKKEDMQKHPLVREGEIDIETIDKNKDGKVFQDPMDWNVISDEPGKCPLCEMKLKEVSLKQVKKNLIDHGHKVKGHMHDMMNKEMKEGENDHEHMKHDKMMKDKKHNMPDSSKHKMMKKK